MKIKKNKQIKNRRSRIVNLSDALLSVEIKIDLMGTSV